MTASIAAIWAVAFECLLIRCLFRLSSLLAPASAGQLQPHEPEAVDDDPELAAMLERYQRLTAEMVLVKQLTNSTATSYDGYAQAFQRFLYPITGTAQQMLTTYDTALRVLEKGCHTTLYVYDICRNSQCSMIYRCEFKDMLTCPCCGTDRFGSSHQRRTLLYSGHAAYVKYLWSIPPIAR